MTKLFIAIDGPSASGKGTIAKKLGESLNLPVLYTGNLYRAVAFAALSQHLDANNNITALVEIIRTIKIEDLENAALMDEQVGEYASVIAAIPEIRKALYGFQRNFIESSNGAIIEGRDIGTVICPDASIKFFLTANTEIRAARRHSQQNQVSFETILNDLKKRDERDRGREAAPLQVAKDAIIIDSSNLNVQETFEKFINLCVKT